MKQLEKSQLEQIPRLISLIWGQDPRYRILRALPPLEGISLRQLAKQARISHSNLSRYLDVLLSSGILESFQVNPQLRAYRIRPELEPILAWALSSG